MDDLHVLGNSLREINLTIGSDEKMIQPCSVSNSNVDIYDIYANINCSSLNASKLIIKNIS